MSSSDMRGDERGDVLVTDIEELENLDASRNPSSKTQCKRGVDITQGENFIFSNKFCGRDHEFREPTPRGNNLQGVKISVVKLKANRESLHLQKQQMTLKPLPIFGRSKVTSSIGITMNLELNQLHVPKEETFSIPGIHLSYKVYSD